MDSKFAEVLIDKFHFTKSEVELTAKMFTNETFKAKRFFVEEGGIASRLGIVTSGLFRTYFVNSDADEITTAFHEPHTLLLSIKSFNNQVASKENIVAIENSEILSITYSDWEKLNGLIPKWLEIRKTTGDIMEMSLQARARNLQTLTAKERYEKFCKKHPLVIQKAPLGQIASYLGIDIATLSRIRKRL